MSHDAAITVLVALFAVGGLASIIAVAWMLTDVGPACTRCHVEAAVPGTAGLCHRCASRSWTTP